MSFPYDRNLDAFSRSVNYFIHLARDSQAVGYDGSTALSLCSVACGRYDGFCVTGNESWDYAARTLIVAEAGSKVTDLMCKALLHLLSLIMLREVSVFMTSEYVMR